MMIWDLEQAARELVIGGGLRLWRVRIEIRCDAVCVDTIIRYVVPDRENGRPTELEQVGTRLLSEIYLTKKEDAVPLLLDELKKMVMHELVESLRVVDHLPTCIGKISPYSSKNQNEAIMRTPFYTPGLALPIPCLCPVKLLRDAHEQQNMPVSPRR